MAIIKSTVQNVINLQNGMFCHFTPSHLIISNQKKYVFDEKKIQLDKIRDVRKVRLVVNVFYTLLILSFSIYTQFYPATLLMFVSLWDLRQLKRYKLPINKSKIIPLENISHFEIKRGTMGFNYLFVYIDYKTVKSFISLSLYDSESTLQNSIVLVEKTGKKIIKPASGTQKISGEFFPTSDVGGYILNDGKLRFIEHKEFDPNRIDNYKYLRTFSVILICLGLSALLTKINMMTTSYNNYVDYTVLSLICLMLLIPIKYLFKALPNEFAVSDIKSIKDKKNKYVMEIKNSWNPLQLHFSKNFIDDRIFQLIENKK